MSTPPSDVLFSHVLFSHGGPMFRLSAVAAPVSTHIPDMPPILVLILLAALGLFISLALLTATRRTLPGCGPRSSCQAVMATRWSRLGPIPVAAFAN